MVLVPIAILDFMADRIEFPERVRRTVAGRSGYRCSFPDCGRGTIGPGPGSEVTTSGVCAHIFSAAPRGPRGQGGLSPEDLQSIQNAIWLCDLHADLVDKNRGDRYPPEMLLSFKDLHEARVVHDQGGLSPQFFWVQEVRLHGGPVFAAGTALRLGKVTVVIGDNESGKSVLCRWVAGLSDVRLLESWDVRPSTEGPDVSVVCFTPSGRQNQRANIPATGHVDYSVDEKPVPIIASPVRSIYLRSESPPLDRQCAEDDLVTIAKGLGLTPGLVYNLIQTVNDDGDGMVRNLRVDEDGGRHRLYADVQGTIPGLPFGGLSYSEQVVVMIRFAAAYANTVATAAPTILMLDGGVCSLDSRRLKEMTEFLLRTEHRFQSLVVLPTGRTWPKPWLGWEFARLIGTATGVRVEQSAE
jgi:hypothetical protein